ncbi:hypothetical protein ACJJIW_15885 [Microbulbifer sp. JMSA004]|uniref:hypothetical protein n=1 Tax=Microbulbifer sp. JMSA004 TaxID=3243370 RepID=UPI00403A5754
MYKNILNSIVLTVIFSSTVFAGEIDVIPSDWKLENYTDNGAIKVFNVADDTNNICTSFHLDSATTESKNRFWSTVLAAKAANSKMFVRYVESDSASCEISSFGQKSTS